MDLLLTGAHMEKTVGFMFKMLIKKEWIHKF